MDIRRYSSITTLFKLAALITTVSLLSCGGSDSASDFSVGGAVTGLDGSVTLQNNNEVITVTNSGRFTFNDRLDTGSSYNVQIQAQPVGQTCVLTNASGTVSSADVSNVLVACGDPVFTLSGRYQAAPLIQVDSDVNDFSAVANVNNGTFLEAQSIPNFSIVNGFSTLAGTSVSTGTNRAFDGDRFADSEDEFDVYRVNLQKNQTIRLQVVDFSGVDVFQGDLDLFLFDLGENDQGFSDSTTEFESVTVPADGDYYIVVAAFSGSSKYTLSLNGVSAAAAVSQNSVDFRLGESVIKFKTSAQINSFTNSFKASNKQIKFSHLKTARAALARFDASSAASASILRRSKTSPGFVEELKQKNNRSYQKYQTLRQIKQLSLHQDIEYAEPNYIYKPLLVPDDEYYSLQWHYPAIKLPQAWDITTGFRAGSNVIVAVVDTGVFLAHPDLDSQLVAGYDFISDSVNAADGDGIDNNPDDPGDSAQLSSSSWHGTHVSGTVAAETDTNGSGVAGVAWQAKIMPVRVLGTQGGTSYDIIQAIRYAAGLSNDSGGLPVQKADIINLSLGGGGFSQASQDAYTAVRDAGVIVVAAAGNENTSQLSYPASYDGVVSVSATDFANNRAPYSNFGTAVDVAAPGGSQGVDLNNDGFGDGVLSTLVDDSNGSRVGVFSFYQGTSMATPHVAGVFALMRAVYPALTPVEVDSLLSSGAITTDLGVAGRDDIYGHGLLDALKAVQEAQKLGNGGVLPLQPALIVATPNQLAMGGTSMATLVVSNESADTPASITAVTTDSIWLDVAEGTVDGNKLGDYVVTIDRGLLVESSYLGTITFSLSTGSSLQVQVSMDVGNPNKTGDPGTVYLLLINSNDFVIDQVFGTDSGNGIYDYSFTGVTEGSYIIVGGSDIDNDVFICQLAESCGGYPLINALSAIDVVDSDISGLNFVVDILANFGASNLSSENNISSKGYRRIIHNGSDAAAETKQVPR